LRGVGPGPRSGAPAARRPPPGTRGDRASTGAPLQGRCGQIVATESGNLADIGPTTGRLLANQTDIGNALKPFYGEAAGNQVTALLHDHILRAADLVAAAKAGDAAAVETASAAWYQNADDIATALNGLNPKHWPLAEMKAHMKDHLDLTLEEAVARLQGRYADDIAAYDKIHVQILGMADMLSDGIIAQFPAKFAR
jgi:hypothetical protein